MGKKTAEKRRKRLKFFDLGNTRCPICLRSFTRDAAEKGQTVTLEHVPPETLGGSVKCLTCKPCNNSAGRKLDRAAERMNRAIMDLKAGLGRKVVVNACGSQETGYLSMDGGLDPEAIRRLPGGGPRPRRVYPRSNSSGGRCHCARACGDRTSPGHTRDSGLRGGADSGRT